MTLIKKKTNKPTDTGTFRGNKQYKSISQKSPFMTEGSDQCPIQRAAVSN